MRQTVGRARETTGGNRGAGGGEGTHEYCERSRREGRRRARESEQEGAPDEPSQAAAAAARTLPRHPRTHFPGRRRRRRIPAPLLRTRPMRETAAAAVRSTPTAAPPLHRDVRRAATAEKKTGRLGNSRVSAIFFFFYFSSILRFFFFFVLHAGDIRPTDARARALRNDVRPHRMLCEFILIARARARTHTGVILYAI